MKTRLLGAAVMTAIVGVGFAAGASAQEYSAYRNSPQSPWSDNYDQLANFQSSKSRAAVAAEAAADRDEVHATVSEDSGSAQLASQFKSSLTRAQVTAEYLADREEAHAAVGEDSGASYYASHQHADNPTRLAGGKKSTQ
jgi:predicted acylesterase/phospholipase RssA